MKFLLIPITLVLWLVLTYLLLWLGLSASLVVLNFSWIALLFSSVILIALGTLISVVIPTAISVVIEKFYNDNRFVNALHALSGVIGVLLFLNYLTADHLQNILRLNWVNHRWKIIILSIPISGMFLAMLYSSISMVLIKKKDNDYSNEDDEFMNFLRQEEKAN